jgi:two-component system chemotaxis sensor kinase CheA
VVKSDLKGERAREFLAEAEDILASMGKYLVKLGKGVKAGVIDPSVLNSIFRSAHTLKGVAAVFEHKEMAALSHVLEDTLDALRLGRAELSEDTLSNIMKAHDLLARLAASSVSLKGKPRLKAEAEGLAIILAKGASVRKAKPGSRLEGVFSAVLTEYEEHRLRENLLEGKNVYIVNAQFPITTFDKSYMAFAQVLRVDAEVIATLPAEKTASDDLEGSFFFDIIIGTSKHSEEVFDALRANGAISIRPLSASTQGSTQNIPAEDAPETLRRTTKTVRVNIKKLDNVMSLVSEFGILKTSLARLSSEIKNDRAASAHCMELSRIEKALDRRFAELRTSVIGLRMVPLTYLFGRYETFIDKVARESGKEMRMVTYGDDTELDKLIVEELADPIMHIIRNVIDHAIEPPDEREAAGKPRVGTVTLSAYQKGSHIVVEVKDDGMGMDEEFLAKKALEKGLITKEALSGLSRGEQLELIFLPGFSTKDEVSAGSGRGVGMDVVRENISRLSGIIDIETAKGKGTRLIITIPTTFAIVEAVIVTDGAERYAIPLNSVVEVIELDGQTVLTAENYGFVTVGSRRVPAIRLGQFFGRKTFKHGRAAFAVVAGLAEQRVCLLFDKVVEELDVVIKPLPPLFKSFNTAGIAGATDMDGKGTVLVLDVTGIIDVLMKDKKAFAVWL